MVGEIRDFETAEIAVKAALTGHLVLSTLHTNDAPSTVSRLLNMGIEPFLVTASVNLIMAQRLARKICPDCREETIKEEHALVDMGMKKEDAARVKIFRGRGCKACSNTGYRGRIALYEVMPFVDALKEQVLQGASTAELKAEMIRLGMKTLRLSGITKIIEGVTTPEEVLRVSVADA
jgi:type IV pilus assembly protein PilB